MRICRALIALLALGLACAPSGRTAAPNVIWIVLDTLRADRLGCYGYPRPTSPNLDAIAADGARFTDATSQSSWTMPSMASMIQGQYATAFRDVPRDDQATLAEIFQGAGYRTEGLVANTLLTEENGFHRGFDYYDAEAQPKDVRDERFEREGIRDVARWAEDMVPLALDRADAYLDRGEEQPLLLYVHLMDVHAKYRPHPDLAGQVTGEVPLQLPTDWHRATFASYAGEEAGSADGWGMINVRRDLYDREVRHTDAWVQRLLDGLADRGLLENAVIAIASDHGESLWEQRAIAIGEMPDWLGPQAYFQAQHDHNLTQCLVHVPLILAGTGISAGTVIDTPVENIDLLPTLMELCDLPNRGVLHGRSLVPAMRGAQLAPQNVHALVLQRRMLRDPRTGYKLTWPTDVGGAWSVQPQLFHLPEDGIEHQNLIDQEPDRARAMRELLDAWVQRYPDTSTLGRERNARTLDMLKALGYAAPGDD